MGLISLLWGIVALLWMIVALIPLLGWGNWFLIPFAAATGDHQTANARGLAEAGAAVVMAEGGLDAGQLSTQMAAVLGNPAHTEVMARAALAQGRPDATDRLVALVEALAGKE